MKLWQHVVDATDEYAKQSKWTDFALLKFCFAAAGVMIGLATPTQKKKPVFFGAAIVCSITGIPLMMKFFPLLKKQCGAPCSAQRDLADEPSEP